MVTSPSVGAAAAGGDGGSDCDGVRGGDGNGVSILV